MRGLVQSFGLRLVQSLGRLLVFPLLLTACGGEGTGPAGEGPAPGRLVIIGGGLQAANTAVYRAVLDGREGDGPLCVFPTASASPQESTESTVGRFDAVGGPGTAQGIFLTVDDPEDASLPATAEQIQSCSGFYFVGGQQSRIVRVFRPDEGDTPAYAALLERHAAGAVVSGSSAGAAIMPDPMIGGGSSLGALNAGVRAGEDGEGVVLQKGMGLLERAFVDQHSLARGRWARLLVALFAEDAYDLGFGIDENTALVVQGDSAWVVGESGVAFFDTRDATPDENGNAGSDVLLYLLGSGDGVDLETGAVEVSAEKTPLARTGQPFGSSEAGLFERWALLSVLAEAAVASDTHFPFLQDGHRLTFDKGPGFEVWARDGLGPEGTPAGLFVGPFILSVMREGAD